MLVKVVVLFLLAMVVVAMVGNVLYPGALRRRITRQPGAGRCKQCGRPQIGRACDCKTKG